MSKALPTQLEPRKTPLQARSTASVTAIMQATVQVLLKEGRLRLTTTRIAQRAGVSVGTLYQYFPNKSSLLQALLKDHLDGVALAMETACEASYGAPLASMARTITSAFVHAKFSHIHTSIALYAVSDDVEGKRIARGMHTRSTKAMAAMFRTAPEKPIMQPELVAATLLSAMAGVSRVMLETGVTTDTMAIMEKELNVLVRSYLEASSGSASAMPSSASAPGQSVSRLKASSRPKASRPPSRSRVGQAHP